MLPKHRGGRQGAQTKASFLAFVIRPSPQHHEMHLPDGLALRQDRLGAGGEHGGHPLPPLELKLGGEEVPEDEHRNAARDGRQVHLHLVPELVHVFLCQRVVKVAAQKVEEHGHPRPAEGEEDDAAEEELGRPGALRVGFRLPERDQELEKRVRVE